MNNKEKAKEIAENSKQYFYHDEYECGLACTLRMAQYKDEQFKQIVKDYIDLAYSSGQEANLLEDILTEL